MKLKRLDILTRGQPTSPELQLGVSVWTQMAKIMFNMAKHPSVLHTLAGYILNPVFVRYGCLCHVCCQHIDPPHASFHSDEWHCDSVAFLQGRRRVMCAYAEFRYRWFGDVSAFEMQVNVQLVSLEQMTEFSCSAGPLATHQLPSWTVELQRCTQ